MGRIAVAKGDYETAEHTLKLGYDLHEKLHFAQGLADICLQLTDLYLLQKKHALAWQYAEESLGLYQESKTLYGMVAMLVRSAHAMMMAREFNSVRTYLLDAIELSIGHETVFPDILSYLALLAAELGWHQDKQDAGLSWLALAMEAGYLWPMHDQYATDLLADWQLNLGGDAWQTAVSQAALLSIPNMLLEVKQTFAAPFAPQQTQVQKDDAQDTAVSANQSLLDPLTKRELEVLQLIADGYTNRQIAETLIISTGTVKYYTSHIYSKLQVASRTQAVAYARDLGILG